jgi:hypothetical protein
MSSPIVPRQLLLLPSPFNRDADSRYLEGPFSEELGAAALRSLELLVDLYVSGYPEVDWAYGSERLEHIDLAVTDLKPSFQDLASPDLLARLGPADGITPQELEGFLKEFVPRRALQTLINVEGWLSKYANGRLDLDWPGARRILELAEAHWRQLPPEVGEYLVVCAGHTNQRRAFPLLRAYVEDLSVPEINRSTVRFVASMIENPIDPKAFDIPQDA